MRSGDTLLTGLSLQQSVVSSSLSALTSYVKKLLLCFKLANVFLANVGRGAQRMRPTLL